MLVCLPWVTPVSSSRLARSARPGQPPLAHTGKKMRALLGEEYNRGTPGNGVNPDFAWRRPAPIGPDRH